MVGQAFSFQTGETEKTKGVTGLKKVPNPVGQIPLDLRDPVFQHIGVVVLPSQLCCTWVGLLKALLPWF